MSTEHLPSLVTISAASRVTGLSTFAIYQEVLAGRMPRAAKVGDKPVIWLHPDDVRALVLRTELAAVVA